VAIFEAAANGESTDDMGSDSDYMFGYSEDEHRRLVAQSELFNELTEDLFRRAGLRPGMHVLDVGAGAGDVSILAARLVGETGSVLGIDRAAESVARAQERIRRMGLTNVRFLQGELADLHLDHQVDACVGRLILLYLPDPERVVKHLLTCVRPGGVIAFQEMDMDMARAVPQTPVVQQARSWIRETAVRAGFEPEMGTKLLPLLRRAGVGSPQARMAARVESGPDSAAYDYIAQTVRSLLPATEKLGIATPHEVQIDTLAERLRADIAAHDAVVILPPLTGVWGRV
jgi:ubiquinone/menaquinone biosynthesis C-methylase UbiE